MGRFLIKLRKNYLLVLIFTAVFLFQVFFAFNTPYLGDGDAYFNLRNIEHIRDNFFPMFYDDLGFGGRYDFFPPLFFYVMALMPFAFLLKLVPILFMTSLVVIVYFLAKNISGNKNAALLSSLMAGFLPVLYFEVFNKLSILTLFVPLVFYSIYCFRRVGEKNYMNYFIILSFVLPLLHPLAFLFSFSLLLSFLFADLESIKLDKLRREMILFSVFITLFFGFLFFKNPFLDLGLKVIWQNVPSGVLVDYFRNFSVLDTLYKVGFLPVILGSGGIVLSFLKYKKQSSLLVNSLFFATLVLLLLRLIKFEVGLIFLGVCLVVLSSLFVDKLMKYIKLTKFSYFGRYFNLLFVFLVLFSLIIPCYFVADSVIKETISKDEFDVLFSLRRTPQDSVILSSVEEGDYITAISERKNVVDSHFLFVNDANERYDDVQRIFTTSSEVVALRLMDKYDVRYIYISDKTKEIYNVDKMVYLNNEGCFDEVYKFGRVEAYRVRC